MSKRNLEYELFNESKKQKINENIDFNNSSPLLFFEENSITGENNNISELFYDVSCKNDSNIEEIFTALPQKKINDITEDSVKENYETELDIFNSEPLIEKIGVNEAIAENFIDKPFYFEPMENVIEQKNDVLSDIDYFEINNIVNSTIIPIIKEITNDISTENTKTQSEYDTSEIIINESNHVTTNVEIKDIELNIVFKDLHSMNGKANEVAEDLPTITNEPMNDVVDIEPEVIKKDSNTKKTHETLIEDIKPKYKLRSSFTKLEKSNEEQKDKVTPSNDKRTPNNKKTSSGENKTPSNDKKTPSRDKKIPLKEKKATFNEENIISNSKIEPEIANDENELSASIARRKSLRIVKRENVQKENLDIVHVIKEKKSTKKKTNQIDEIKYYDPGTWPEEIPNDMKIKLVKKGPVQVETFEFPKDETNRCFPVVGYLTKNLRNENMRRYWLLYSISRDAAFCFPCRIFGYESQSSFANSGFRNWKKLPERLKDHQDSARHLSCMDQWSRFSIDDDNSTCGLSLTQEKAVRLAGQLKHFSVNIDNEIYLLAKQLETEILNCVHNDVHKIGQK